MNTLPVTEFPKQTYEQLQERLRIVSVKSARRKKGLRQMAKTLKITQDALRLSWIDFQKLRTQNDNLLMELREAERKIPWWRK